MTQPHKLSSAGLVRLVAVREMSTRIRDKSFIISSVVIILLIVGSIGFQVFLSSGGDKSTIGVVGDSGTLTPALQAQGKALGVDVTVHRLDDEAAARSAVESGDVDGALVDGNAAGPHLIVKESADGSLLAVVQGAVSQLSVSQQLARVGVTHLDMPEVAVTPLEPDAAQNGQRIGAAVLGVSLLYGLLILFGQFIAQGVVEEKSSRVVELLLATLRPWQLLAGKVIGLGVLGLGQIVVIVVIGVGGALAFDIIDVPGEIVGTGLSVVAWFVLGYAFYAAIFAVAASLVSRQEDLGTVLMPTSLLLVGSLIIGIQAAGNPGGTLATVTSYIPGLSPMVMPVRQAAGHVAAWEVALAVVLMLVAIALVVRLGGRVYSAALLRTSGKTKLKDAFRAERV